MTEPKNSRKNLPYLRRALGPATASALVLSTLVSCAPGAPKQASDLAANAGENVGCQSFEDEFWDGLYRINMSGQAFPSEDQMRASFEDTIRNGRLKTLSEADKVRIRESLTELYRLLALDSVQTLSDNPEDSNSSLSTLASLEMGDRTTPEKSRLQDKIRAQFAEVESIASAAGASNCASSGTPGVAPQPGAAASPAPNAGSTPGATATPTPSTGSTPQPSTGGTPAPVATPPPAPTAAPQPQATPVPIARTMLDEWRATRHPAVFGGLKGIATAYQSCDSGLLPAITSRTGDVAGISIVGRHPNGAGNVRVVSSLNALIRTHYYLSSYQKPASSCFAVLSNPMIYDYGGKPYTTADQTSTLDFFRDAGTGSAALGIDCSGYVYSSLATGGLKLKKSGRLKAVGVHGVNSAMFMNPQSNGLTCLDYVTFKGQDNLRPGDVLASSGHVILIESVGNDPLGIASITKESDCTASKMSVSRFNFTILQSSPSKGGIGINRMRAADYLADGGSMATAMLTHAANACLAKFRNTSVTTKSSSANLIRHSGTSDCVDTAIKLAKEECVASCPAGVTAQMIEDLP